MRRNVELLCENLPVASGLIEHIDEIAVLKDVLNLPAGQQVFDILGDLIVINGRLFIRPSGAFAHFHRRVISRPA